MTGQLLITLSSGTVGLNVRQTASGRILFAQDELRSSGTLIVTGASTLRGAATLTSTLNVTGNTTIDTNTLFVDASGNKVGILTITPDSALEVVGTASGDILFATKELRSSGTLVVQGNARFKNTLTLNGVTYTFPAADGASGTTLKTAGNGTLVWSTDRNDGASSFTQTTADARYVNTSGDTMTGQLLITLSSGTVGLNVRQTASGRILFAQDELRSSGRLVVTGASTFNSTMTIAAGSHFLASASAAAEKITRATTAVDTGGDVGKFSSIAIATDGTPIISYYDQTNADLKVTKCGNAACSTGNTTTTIDSTGDVGQYSSIAIGSDGYAVISYYDATNTDLKVAKCTNATCSTSSISTFSSANNIGAGTSIAIGWDGNPIIAYYDATNDDLIVTKCGTTSCASGNTTTSTVTTGTVGRNPSIAIGTDGMPSIAYQETGVGQVMYSKCSNVACTATFADQTITTGGFGISLMFRANGLPMIFHATQVNALNVVTCTDTQCATSAARNIATNAASGSAIMGNDGMAIFSYYGTLAGDLMIAKCRDSSCDTDPTATSVDSSAALMGQFTSIALGADGNPVVSYYAGTAQDLRVARCANPSCSAASGSGSLTGIGSDIGSRGQYFRNIYAAQYWGREFQIADFADLAENYRTLDPTIAAGDIVAVATGTVVRKADAPYDPAAIGIVSTKAGITLGKETGSIPVALVGRIPVKVMRTGSSSAIEIGDAIAPSQIPGFGMKADRAGHVVGTALEDMSDWSSSRCQRIDSPDDIVWPIDNGTNQHHPCFWMPGSGGPMYFGKIMSFARTTWHEPALEILTGDDIPQIEGGLVGSGAVSLESMSGATLEVEDGNATALRALRDEVTDALDAQISRFSILSDRMSAIDARLTALSGSIVPAPSVDDAFVLPEDLALSGSLRAEEVSADSLALESTLIVGGMARIGGDLHLDGSLIASSLTVPQGLTIDGTTTISGPLSAASGSTIRGTLVLDGDLDLRNGTIRTPSILSIERLMVKEALHVIGPMTIEGLAQFLGDVDVHGTLRLSTRQAGYAVVPTSQTGTIVTFGSGGFANTPIITATPDHPVVFAITAATQTGFTIELGWPMKTDVRLSWIAIPTLEPPVYPEGSASINGIAFPVDHRGVPISSSLIWNACIDQRQPLDGEGNPFNCARYHDRDSWEHPDLHMFFLWDESVSPPRLTLPDGYVAVMQADGPDGMDLGSFSSSTSSASSAGTGTELTPPIEERTSSSRSLEQVDTSSGIIVDPPSSETSVTEELPVEPTLPPILEEETKSSESSASSEVPVENEVLAESIP
jgi:hypothetical protein